MSVGNVSMLRNCGRFLMGEWATPVGQMCYEARKNKTAPSSLLSFGWKDAYKTHWAGVDATKAIQAKFQPQLMESINNAISGLGTKATAEAKKQAVEQAGKTFLGSVKNLNANDKKILTELVDKTVKSESNTGFFSKIGKFFGKIPGLKFVGKNIFPILFAVQAVSGAISGYKDSGIGGAIKEATRGLLKTVGYAVAATLVAACGITGLAAFVVAGLFSMFVLDKGIDFVFGKTPEEKQLLAQEAEKNQFKVLTMQ